MKFSTMTLSAITVAAGMVMATQSVQASEALAQKNNCMSCHSVGKKLVGPAFKDIAARYKGKGAEAALVAKIRSGGSGAWGAIPMPPNPAVSDADAKALVKWIVSM